METGIRNWVGGIVRMDQLNARMPPLFIRNQQKTLLENGVVRMGMEVGCETD